MSWIVRWLVYDIGLSYIENIWNCIAADTLPHTLSGLRTRTFLDKFLWRFQINTVENDQYDHNYSKHFLKAPSCHLGTWESVSLPFIGRFVNSKQTMWSYASLNTTPVRPMMHPAMEGLNLTIKTLCCSNQSSHAVLLTRVQMMSILSHPIYK